MKVAVLATLHVADDATDAVRAALRTLIEATPTIVFLTPLA